MVVKQLINYKNADKIYGKPHMRASENGGPTTGAKRGPEKVRNVRGKSHGEEMQRHLSNGQFVSRSRKYRGVWGCGAEVVRRGNRPRGLEPN